jgi:glutamate-ammonia-ligase adenylyltransferase
MERLIRLDCDAQAPLSDITRAVTELAEFALDQSCLHARRELDSRHGAPLSPDGQPVQLWVIGMGKLGARELNVSSDIDLIYVYDRTANRRQPRGRGAASPTTSTLPMRSRSSTAWSATPPSTALSSAWTWRCGPTATPARPCVAGGAGGIPAGAGPRMGALCLAQEPRGGAARAASAAAEVLALRSVVLPFVFRRYLDYSVFDALRSCTARSASTQPSAAPATPSAPTT